MKSLRQGARSAKTKKAQQKRVASPQKKKLTKQKKPTYPKIHRWMNVQELAELHPSAGDILATYGLHCIGCAYSEVETLEEGAKAHGLTDDDIDNILIDLEDLLKNEGEKPLTLTITESAAHALSVIARQEKKEGWFLSVTTDDAGKFCMEFVAHKDSDHHTFGHPNVPTLSILASTDTLQRIGGATIDHREGRFKLDLMKSKMCGCDEKGCACKKM